MSTLKALLWCVGAVLAMAAAAVAMFALPFAIGHLTGAP